MKSNGAVTGVLQKLDWISRLSKETLPGGMPTNAEDMRKLLNRIVLDVRAACRDLEKVEFPGESDVSDMSDKRKKLDRYGIAEATPEAAANTLLCLVNQATYLLKGQIEKLERDFVEEGGFTERLYRIRSERRQDAG